MSERRRLSGTNIAVIVVALSAAVVLAPVGVMAATGTLVNITDPYNSAARARVDSGKVRVGDGNGALTVDGTVKDGTLNAVIYQSPAGGLDCGANSAGIPVGTISAYAYSKIRVIVESSASYQTILAAYPRAGSDVAKRAAYFDYTTPANSVSNTVFDAPPTRFDLRAWFCNDAKIFIYGIR